MKYFEQFANGVAYVALSPKTGVVMAIASVILATQAMTGYFVGMALIYGATAILNNNLKNN